MSDALLLGGALVGLLLLALVVLYNKLVAVRNRVAESWSNVDTELKRRHDLVPNLVATVQAYAQHERALLHEVTSMRARALAGGGDTDERRRAEDALARALGRLVAVAEAYPTLRASEPFLRLQRDLVDTEDRIQAARRFFNANVRDLNNRVETFPSSLVARGFGFRAHPYFELAGVVERQAPRVEA